MPIDAPKGRSVVNIGDLRRRAYRRLPAPAYHYLDGGADDERTLARNMAAFEDVRLLPRILRPIASVDTATTLFGKTVAAPLMLSPTGLTRLFHRAAEPAVARAAAAAGLPYSLSTMGTTSMETIAAIGDNPKIFQLYIFRDRGLTEDLLTRAKASGFDAICLTVDTAIAGNRERDHRTGMTIPPKFGARSFFQFAARPRWSLPTAWDQLRGRGFRLPNVEGRVDALKNEALSLIGYVNSQFDPDLTWDDFAWLREHWTGTLIIKGLLAPDDCIRAVEMGADAIMISNHGGRQLDDVPAPVEMLPKIRDAIGGQAELIVDGGIRRGSDIFKALALGADACSVGRPYLYGLAADGERGVAKALHILTSEFARTMALAGARTVSGIDGGYLVGMDKR
ncbi:alpha-hydroxy acid oxidase [uncultured Algimonas sp.]|uniref:alpha-hydroxy acid oxidase n=1 Tax=uncultured Algimonas sp. TaxID=1547920 RepID=UPI00262E73D8|nr:alpha-hydroxy acid oxidase [uncultured Algimonas sp.]